MCAWPHAVQVQQNAFRKCAFALLISSVMLSVHHGMSNGDSANIVHSHEYIKVHVVSLTSSAASLRATT